MHVIIDCASVVFYLLALYCVCYCLFIGCMWSVCGIHDQGWAERPVFGKIRYMNYQGCKRKFDVEQFERKYNKKRKTGKNRNACA